MENNRYANIGKGSIVEEGIFVRFPELVPASLENYWNSKKHKKLLIVGESNYFDDDVDSVFKDPQAWYSGAGKQYLVPEGKKKDVNNYKGYKTFDRLSKTMNEVLNETLCEHVYEEAMFYNYFLRPATLRKNNRTFKKIAPNWTVMWQAVHYAELSTLTNLMWLYSSVNMHTRNL